MATPCPVIARPRPSDGHIKHYRLLQGFFGAGPAAAALAAAAHSGAKPKKVAQNYQASESFQNFTFGLSDTQI